MDINLLIAHISSTSVLIPLSLAILQWRRLPDEISPLRWILVFSALADLTQLTLYMYISTTLVANLYMFIQFTLLLYIFSFQFQRKNVLKIAYVVVVVLYVVGLILLKKYKTSTDAFDAIASLVLIVVSILFFYKLISGLKVANIFQQPILWIAFATLFYYAGNMFLFLATSYLLDKTILFRDMWIQHNILNFTKNVLFAVALWQHYRTMKLSA